MAGSAAVSQWEDSHLTVCFAVLEHTEASGAAASAIRNICHSCGRYLASSYLEGLMQLYQKVQGQGAAAPIGTQKLAERDVLAVSLPYTTDNRVMVCRDLMQDFSKHAAQCMRTTYM